MNIYDELFVLSFDILSLYCNKVLCWIPTISLSVWKTIKTHHLTIKKTQVYYEKPPFSQGFLSRFFPLSLAASPRTSGSSPPASVRRGVTWRPRCKRGWEKTAWAFCCPSHEVGQHVESCGFLSCFPAKVNKKQLRTQHSLEFWREMIKNLDIWLTWPLNNVEIPWNPLV